MIGEMGCDQVRDLAPELALGVAEGQERDAALRHLTGCAGCRQLVADLSTVGDELLSLVPPRDPPRGFESRVLADLGHAPARRTAQLFTLRRQWVAAAAAAAVVLAAVLGGVSVYWATADERRLADSYQAVLSQGQGDFFLAAPLRGSQGRVGTVFAYQGNPSWAMMTAQPTIEEEGRFQAEVLTRDGRYLPAGDVVLGGARQAGGVQLPVDLSEVQEIRFMGPDGQLVFVATFNTSDNPWN
jgi:hypothetical protein